MGAAVVAHVEEIVRTAEREAGIIQRDLEAHRRAAEEQAQRYLEDAKRQAEALVQSRVELVRELAAELIEHAESTRRQVDALIAWLDRATERLQEEQVSTPRVAKPPWRQRGGPRLPAAEARPRPGQVEPEPPALRPVTGQPRPAARPEAPDAPGERLSAGKARPGAARETSQNLDAARLLAIEMAVSGRTREEVDAHLRERFTPPRRRSCWTTSSAAGAESPGLAGQAGDGDPRWRGIAISTRAPLGAAKTVWQDRSVPLTLQE